MEDELKVETNDNTRGFYRGRGSSYRPGFWYILLLIVALLLGGLGAGVSLALWATPTKTVIRNQTPIYCQGESSRGTSDNPSSWGCPQESKTGWMKMPSGFVPPTSYGKPVPVPAKTAAPLPSGIAAPPAATGPSTVPSDQGQIGVGVGDDGGQGALVEAVLAGSPAVGAGLKSGDLIVALNGSKVTSAGSLQSLLSKISAGTSVSLTVIKTARS